MPNRNEIRSEETKRAILTAAGQLFAERGFDKVTMREIAKTAGCSHTTIYIYFQDKEALLHTLSMDPLQSLRQRMEAILANAALASDQKIKALSWEFVRFCFTNRNLFHIFFMMQAERVDVEAPALEINQLRNHLFGLLRQAIQEHLQLEPQDTLALAYARICFYSLHGFLATYAESPEPLDPLMERLGPTFDLNVDVLLAGFKQTMTRGVDLG